MIESLINKVFFLIFFMCVFNIVRHVWEIIRRLRADDGWKKKYEISTLELTLLILSISYLLSTIFVGIKI
jgi:hypothetical protein